MRGKLAIALISLPLIACECSRTTTEALKAEEEAAKSKMATQTESPPPQTNFSIYLKDCLSDGQITGAELHGLQLLVRDEPPEIIRAFSELRQRFYGDVFRNVINQIFKKEQENVQQSR